MSVNTPEQNQKLGLLALVAIVVSSMIGAGIDGLPQNMAQQSALGPVVIAWLVAGFGMFFIAKTFIILNTIRPELKDGIYMYAKEGFGPYVSFTVAWGYWLMCIFSNVAYGVMLMDAMNYFFPGDFTGGNNFASIIGATLLIWGFNFLVLSGAKDASLVNTIGTVAKLIPLVIFIFIVVYFMKVTQLNVNVWGDATTESAARLGSVYKQIMSPLDIALWCFIGIEGAVVLSGRAKKESDVGKATIWGFIISLALCILVSVLPFGVMTQYELSQVETPSTAGVLKYLTGEWGELFISFGVIISVLSAWLAWTMLCAEVPMSAAQNGTFPKLFAKQNKNKAASVALYISSALMQLALVLVYYSNDAWITLLDISSLTVLPAYLTSTLYLLKIAVTNEFSVYSQRGRWIAIISGFIGAFFCIFMFCISGLQYVAMVPLFLTAGIPVYLYTCWENKKTDKIIKQGGSLYFSKIEYLVLFVLLCMDVISICLYYYDIIRFN